VNCQDRYRRQAPRGKGRLQFRRGLTSPIGAAIANNKGDELLRQGDSSLGKFPNCGEHWGKEGGAAILQVIVYASGKNSNWTRGKSGGRGAKKKSQFSDGGFHWPQKYRLRIIGTHIEGECQLVPNMPNWFSWIESMKSVGCEGEEGEVREKWGFRLLGHWLAAQARVIPAKRSDKEKKHFQSSARAQSKNDRKTWQSVMSPGKEDTESGGGEACSRHVRTKK